MAYSTLEQKLAKILECAICLEAYDEPKVLRCQHTYCKNCLEKLVNKSGLGHKVTCPECREETKLPRSGVSGLQSNFSINDLLQLSASTGVQSNKSPPCEKHQEELVDLYCKICDEPVCQACLEIDHRDHLYTSIKDVFARKKKIVAKLMNEAKPKFSALRGELLSIEDEEDKVRNNAVTVSREIDTFIDTAIAKHTASLERVRQGLKKELREKTSLQLSKLQDQKESLVMSLSSLEFATDTRHCANKVEFLLLKKEIASKITKLRSLTEGYRPCEKVVFQLDRKFLDEEKIQGQGKIRAQGECSFGVRGAKSGTLCEGKALQCCEFIITLHGDLATDRQNLMSHFKVNILAPNAETPYTPPLEDNGDGTLSFRYRPECSGDYKISLYNKQFYGEEAYNSPVIWKVLPALPGSAKSHIR